MKVERRCEDKDLEWDAFVSGHPKALPFHRTAWLRVIERGYGFKDYSLVVYNDMGEIAGVFPLFLVDRPLGGKILLSAPQAVYAGPLFYDPASGAALLERALELAAELQVAYLEIRRPPDIAEDPAGWTQDIESRSHHVKHYAMFCKELPPSREDVEACIPRKQRAEVRRARKQGIIVERSSDFSEFYNIYKRSTHLLGSPVFPKAHVEAIFEEFAGDCEILVARVENVPIASLLTLYHRETAMPYYAGGFLPKRAAAMVPASVQKMSPYPMLYAEAMAFAIDRGMTQFDFGRSIIGSGAYDFKKNFGFDPTQLTYEVILQNAKTPPDLRPDAPQHRRVVALWKQLPKGLVDRLGPYLSRQVV